MRLFVAQWFDSEDKLFRVAGVYRTEKAAWNRVAQVLSGSVMQVTLSRPVKFCGEPFAASPDRPLPEGK